jgi:hypothetical protein
VRGKDQPASQLEHGDGTGWGRVVTGKLGADHSRRLQPETVAVKLEGPIEVAYGQGDHMDAGFHLVSLSPRERSFSTTSKSAGGLRFGAHEVMRGYQLISERVTPSLEGQRDPQPGEAEWHL